MAEQCPAATDPATATEALGTVDWAAVASRLTAKPVSFKTPSRSKRVRTAEECRARWIQHEMPGVVSLFDTWTKDEDMCIMEQVEIHGERAWVKVAKEVAKATGRREGEGRTPIACFKRYQAALNPGLVITSRWSDVEDVALLKAIKVRPIVEECR